eukprot:5688135-Ditylum_brightwellii.AAC.1
MRHIEAIKEFNDVSTNVDLAVPTPIDGEGVVLPTYANVLMMPHPLVVWLDCSDEVLLKCLQDQGDLEWVVY